MSTKTPAQVFAPGEFIQEELEARGWTQEDLAEVMGRPRRLVNELVLGKRAITPETATELGAAFGTSAEVWMNLEAAYRLSLVEAEVSEVERRAKAYAYAPVKDMVKRGWISESDNVDDLEKDLKQFFQVPSLDEKPQWPFAAKMSATYGIKTPEQLAWVGRIRNLGKAVGAAAFDSAIFERELTNIRRLIGHEGDVRRIPKILADLGVRFIVVETLPRTSMDGVTTWLSDTAPVVAVSLRYGRIDNLWFTILHECIHVKYGEGSVDENLVGENFDQTMDKPQSEQRADQEAAELLVPMDEMENFILRTRPLYYRTKIVQFANRIRVHPGIIVGQLQRRKELTFAQLRDTLVDVRNELTQSALTDGWGFAPPVK
jgi:HTH-type transcriptional regulator / antitoxin HigA